MTYVPQGPLRHYGLSDDEDSGLATIQKVIAAFLPKINELQAAGDANAQAQVDATIKQATGGTSTAPVTTTKSGGTTASAVSAGDFVNKNGVCKPTNFPALTAAKDLQMQLNRIAKAKAIGTIVVDGDIGPASVGLVGRANTVGAGIPGTGSCTAITASLGACISAAKAFADKIGAPPPTGTEVAHANAAGAITVASTAGGDLQFKPPGATASITDKIKSLPETVKIVGGGALVLGGILLFKKMRSGRRAASSSTPSLALPAAVSNPSRRRRRRRR